MADESVKKKGYLSKLPVKGLVKKWNRRWFILYATSHNGVVRMEYYDSQETARNEVGKRTIPLRDSSALSTTVGNKLHPYVFQLKSQIGQHVLAADSQPDLEDWMESIKQVMQEDRLKRRRTKAQSRVMTSDEDTLLESFSDSGLSYKNKVDSGTYRVTVEENDTSTKMNLTGAYSLELTPTMMTLKAPSGATIFTLSYKCLKNYGKQSGQFHFETGRNSPIGEGKLICVTTCSKEIFGVVNNNIKKLRESNPQERRKSPTGPQPPKQQPQTQPVPRPQPQRPVQPPPQPQKKRQSLGSTSNRPGSRQSSTEIADIPLPGTYRRSMDLEEVGSGRTSATASDETEKPLYSTVDFSKKKSSKQQQQQQKKTAPTQHNSKTKQAISKPDHSNPAEPLYSDPFEADPKYKPPPIPAHKTSSTTRDSRASYALVEVGDNVFFDSFDDDDEQNDLQILTEGASNLLDSFIDFSEEDAKNLTAHAHAEETTTTNTAEVLESLDFGFGPGNLGPPTSDGPEVDANKPIAENSTNLMSFDFDFGGNNVGIRDDPFSSNMAGMEAAGTGDLVDFDLGKLDANFFEKLEAIEVNDQPSIALWGAGTETVTMNNKT